MRIVIIEDEMFAAKRLENMIHKFDSSIEVIAKLESVKESIEWFSCNAEPDLIFLDIHLDDNLSFAIFEEVPLRCAIVFTTATDELAIRIFQLNGIDFLLKPIIQSDLNEIITRCKYKKRSELPINPDMFNHIVN